MARAHLQLGHLGSRGVLWTQCPDRTTESSDRKPHGGSPSFLGSTPACSWAPPSTATPAVPDPQLAISLAHSAHANHRAFSWLFSASMTFSCFCIAGLHLVDQILGPQNCLSNLSAKGHPHHAQAHPYFSIPCIVMSTICFIFLLF